MSDEKTESTDNQTDSTSSEETTAEVKTEQSEQTTEGATSETEKPEFADKDMQAKFTQRMQEISEQEKTYKSGTQKAQAWEQLMSDPEASKMVVDLYNQRSGKTQKEEVKPITQEDLDNAQSDPKAFESLVDKRARAMLEPIRSEMLQLKNEQRSMSMQQDIEDFANAKDDQGNLRHPDFWEDPIQDKMKLHLEALQGSRLSGLQQVETAYRNITYSGMTKKAMDNAHSTVAHKKAAVGEKGTKVPSIPNMKGKSLLEVAKIVAKDMGMDVP